MKKLLLSLSVLLLLGAVPALQAQSNMQVGGTLGLGIPTGSFSDNIGIGFGLNGTFLYNVQPKLYIVGHIGYERFGYKTSNSVESGGYNMIPIVGGARYEIGDGPEFTPYVQADIGFYFLSWSFSRPSYFGSTEWSDSESQLGMAPSVGFTLPLTPTIKLDANLKYHIIFTDVVNTSFIGLNAGILVPLK
jgi:opacity protein-like surface antigen